ncbi:hypothetical protein [Sulfurimonas sp. HSL-1716]|uniref:hypothetical protein n=1 Tax=Hydrocurvibacter sulfurireducens TaxID=3131937 RepID=UPI0031F83F81
MDIKYAEIYNVLSKERKSIEKLIEPFWYRFSRYKLQFCLLIIYAKNLDENYFNLHIRQTDEAVILDKNLICIVFESNNDRQMTEGIEKLLYNQDGDFHKSDNYYYSSMVCSSESEGLDANIINRSFMILEYAFEYQKTNEVLNYSAIFTK